MPGMYVKFETRPLALLAEREDRYQLSGTVQIDDAYLGGEYRGGKAGRGSENKVPFIAVVSTDDEGRPGRVKLTPLSGFTTESFRTWLKRHLRPGCTVFSDGLACFGAVKGAGCLHVPNVVGRRKPDELPEFRWGDTVLSNVKTSLSGSYHAFDFRKYARRYLGVIASIADFNSKPYLNGCWWLR